MKRMTTIAAVLALACAAVAMFAGSLMAQSEPGVYGACAPEKQKIRAGALPEVVDEDRCPVEGRLIVDGGIGAVVPEPGMTITADATLTDGHQHLTVSNPRGDEISLDGVGPEPRSEASSELNTRASGLSPCQDGYYNSWGYKVYNYNRWYANVGSIPDYLSKSGAVAAMKRGGVNIFKVQDSCGVPDRVKGELRYQGGTSRSVDINSDGSCNANDGKSVVSFGDLPDGTLAYACVASWVVDNAPDRVASSDIRLNKEDYGWTTRVRSSCSGRYDVESSVTHERGHTFGLGEASEGSHGNLTMSEDSNGACQTSERSLGRGDARGLNSKY
ncbi:MAG: hypothetical protein M3N33_06025 [Actinomycetota bacterium]|nr:hypothetical protein [Actinomycetota bacterium]